MHDAVCFDNDGLLLATEEAWTRAEVTLFRRHGAEFTPEHKRDLLGSSRAIAAAKLERILAQPGRGHALMDELHELVMAEAAQGVEPMPGAIALVDELRAAGRPLALVSNSAREFVELTLTAAGVRDRFDAVLCAQDVAHPKPAPDLYLAACRQLRADPRRCAGLEDSATGVAALKAAGLLAIGVPSVPGVDLAEADLVAASLEAPEVRRALGLQVA
jgi:HAD superfamily hydrolase (TIGR01509 family)